MIDESSEQSTFCAKAERFVSDSKTGVVSESGD